MEQQAIHPCLSSTSRHFYTRRVQSKQRSTADFNRIMKLLTTPDKPRKLIRVQTEPKQTLQIREWQGPLMAVRAKVQNLSKQNTQIYQLLTAFNNYKKSNSHDLLMKNETQLLQKIEEFTKTKKIVRKKFRDSNDEDNMVHLNQLKLIRENKILNDKLKNQSQKYEQEKFRQSRGDNEQIDRLTRQVQFLKQNNEILRDQRHLLNEKVNQLRQINKQVKDQLVVLIKWRSEQANKHQSWKQTIYMQNQQILSLNRQLTQTRKHLQQIHRKYQLTMQRLNKTHHKSSSALEQLTSVSLQIFTQQKQCFKQIRSLFVTHNYLQPTNITTNDGFYRKFLGQKQSTSNVEGLKRASNLYRYNRPNFYVFVEQYLHHHGIAQQNRLQLKLQLGVDFFILLRTILDSKFNQYLLSGATNFSSLSSFVIGWLFNYSINPRNYSIVETGGDKAIELVATFYLKLMSPQFNGNWEIIAFRQMLMDTLTADELLFYLKARKMLLDGTAAEGPSFLHEIYLISPVQAQKVVQELVRELQYRQKMQQFMKKGGQFRRKKKLIDAHFVLRLLLQYYQYKKSKIISLLSKAFSPYIRSKNNHMDFQHYLRIFDYCLIDLPPSSKAQIYQRAYSLGKELVSLQSVFTILNEQGYFCIQVQKMFTKKSLNSLNLATLTPLYWSIEERVKGSMNQLGVDWMKNWRSNHIQLSQINSEQLINRFQLIIKGCLASLRKQDHSANSFIFVKYMIESVSAFVGGSIQNEQISKAMMKVKKQNAASLILNFYRKRFGYVYKLGRKQKNKAGELRQDFMVMIQKMKQQHHANDKIL